MTAVPRVPAELPAHVPITPPIAHAFWDSERRELVALHWEARRRIKSPWALLAIAITRSLLTIPYAVRYRSALHPEGSPINLALALVGKSGAGKSTAAHGAALAVRWDGEDVPDSTMTRSGEGISALLGYMRSSKGDDGEPDSCLCWYRMDHALWLHYDEVGQLGAQGARTGSTVLDTLKSLTSGERLGGQNSKGDGVTIPGAEYRAVATVAVQPTRAAALLDETAIAGGLSARFLWFAAEDPTAMPTPLPTLETVPVLAPLSQWDQVRYVDALPEMDTAHEADAWDALRGEREAVDSRRLLNRAVVAIALANMAGRAVLIPEDWHLAGLVVLHSDEVLAEVRDALAAPADDHSAELERRAVAAMSAKRAAGMTWQGARRQLSNAQGKALTAAVHAGRVTPWGDDPGEPWPSP